jgi:glutathione synthase/RimK-type ligase-like ATP-grasp enzyme
MMKIALVTCHQISELTVDDQLLRTTLEQLGARADAVIWDSEVDWRQYTVALIRSTWDYHMRPAEFSAWLSAVSAQTHVWNPPEVIRWNIRKTYLRELAEKGISIVPTRWLHKHESVSLTAILEENGWSEAIVKPVIAASAFQTRRVSITAAKDAQQWLVSSLAERDMMVQAFVASIQTHGEWSFMFFDGQFSHAVIKKPKAGDFRVQAEFGGSTQPAQPVAALIDQAKRMTQAIPRPWLYARVDAAEIEGRLVLMELELIEPELFFAHHPDATNQFGEAFRNVEDRLNK